MHKNYRRKEEEFATNHSGSCKLVDILARNVITPKYGDPGTLVITIAIGSKKIPNVLLDLGPAINIITFDLCNKLALNEI